MHRALSNQLSWCLRLLHLCMLSIAQQFWAELQGS